MNQHASPVSAARSLTPIFIALSLTVLPLQHASAQIPTGTIFGQVTDSSNAAVPRTNITATNDATAQVRATTADNNGNFVLPQLAPGSYSISASSTGFSSEVKKGVTVDVNARIEVNLQLHVGSLAQQTTVAAAAVQVETGSSSLDQSISAKQVSDLPLLGRNFVQLASLSAGATPVIFNQQDEGSSNASKPLSVNIAGGRGNWNSWLIDGVEVKNPWFNDPSVQPSVDAIEEFKVMRGTFSAEYGNATAVINIVTKSGSNKFHGTGFEFLRNDVLDARNFFSPQKGVYRYNQFGGNLAGPIIRNRTFFFGYYEGLRSRQQNPIIATLPSTAQLSGDFSNLPKKVLDPLTNLPFPGNVIPPSRFSSVTQNMNAFIPAPNAANGQVITSPSAQDDFDQAGGRVDQIISDNDQVFVRYMFSNEQRFSPGYAPLRGTTGPYSGQNVVLSENHVFNSTSVNSIKLAYNRGILASRYEESTDKISATLGIAGISSYALPAVLVSGFSQLGASSNDQGATTNSYQFGDSLSLVRGRHDITLGVSTSDRRFQKLSNLNANGSFAFDGRYTGNALADYLLGTLATAQDQVGQSVANLQSWTYSLFVEDNFRLSNRLTFNLGLRYDYQQPWAEGDHKEGYFDTGYPGGRLLVGRNPTDFGITLAPSLAGRIVQAAVSPGIIHPDRNNFAPRIGLAYTLTKNTVVRAGYGIFYVDPNANEVAGNFQMPPFQVSQTFSGSPRNPLNWDSLFPGGSTLSGILAPQGGLPLHGATPYVQQRTFSVQHNLKGVLLELGYEGNQAVHLDSRVDINQAFLSTPGAVVDVQTRRPFPLWGDILARQFRDLSNYNSFQAKAERSLSSGFSFLTSYTFSKAIDTQSRVGSTEHQDSFDLNNDRGPAAFDMRQNLIVNLGYDLPLGRGRKYLSNTNHALDALAGGWHANLIASFLSGLPVNPSAPASIANVGVYTAERADCIANWQLPHPGPAAFFNIAAFATPVFGTFGTCGRDIITGPGTQEIDLSVVKSFPITESIRLQVRGEVFNLFNRANFSQPDANVTDATFGQILSARSPRDIQLSMRLSF